MTAFLQPSSAQLWEAVGSQRARGDAAPSRSARPDSPQESGDRHPLTGTAPVPQSDPSTALPDGSATAYRESGTAAPSAPAAAPAPSRSEKPSRAEPHRTERGMRDPEGSTALLFLGRDPPLRPAQLTQAPPRAPPYS